MAILQGGVVRRLPARSIMGGAEFGLWIIPFSFIFVACASNQNTHIGFMDGHYFLYAGLFLFAVCKYLIFNIL